MRAVGIICEYNPFHAGHAYQLSCARQASGAEVVIAVMSEHLTQRGELALCDGYARARSAVGCGADLVIGLPFPYSAAPAEFFALGGVRILNALGASFLHFGSECGDTEALRQAAVRLSSPSFCEALAARQISQPTEGVMESRLAVYEAMYTSPLPGGSNDTLALSYLAALMATDSSMVPLTVRREGQGYLDDDAQTGGYPSASALRRLWREQGLDALCDRIPSPVATVLREVTTKSEAPLSIDALSGAILAYFRTSSSDELSRYAGMEGGLAQRFITAAKECTTLSELLNTVATRRYTTARLWRSLWSALCGVTPADRVAPPAYVRLLAANTTGCAYLSSIRKSCPLPILTKPADLPSGEAAARQRAIEERVEALVTMTYPLPQPSGALLRRSPWIEKADRI